MFENPSLMTRIIVGKSVGIVIGLAGFFLIPLFAPDTGWLLRWGILLWYATLGAIIGVYGVFNWHPVLKLPLPWWLRAPAIGGWMNFVLVFFAYDNFSHVMAVAFGPESFFGSPFWFALEGAIVGLIIGFLATRFGGEGKATVAAV